MLAQGNLHSQSPSHDIILQASLVPRWLRNWRAVPHLPRPGHADGGAVAWCHLFGRLQGFELQHTLDIDPSLFFFRIENHYLSHEHHQSSFLKFIFSVLYSYCLAPRRISGARYHRVTTCAGRRWAYNLVYVYITINFSCFPPDSHGYMHILGTIFSSFIGLAIFFSWILPRGCMCGQEYQKRELDRNRLAWWCHCDR